MLTLSSVLKRIKSGRTERRKRIKQILDTIKETFWVPFASICVISMTCKTGVMTKGTDVSRHVKLNQIWLRTPWPLKKQLKEMGSYQKRTSRKNSMTRWAECRRQTTLRRSRYESDEECCQQNIKKALIKGSPKSKPSDIYEEFETET